MPFCASVLPVLVWLVSRERLVEDCSVLKVILHSLVESHHISHAHRMEHTKGCMSIATVERVLSKRLNVDENNRIGNRSDNSRTS